MSGGVLAAGEQGQRRRVDYSQMTDEQVVALAQAGDEDAVNHLLYKYQKLVYIWTRPYFLQGAEDDDLLQEGMIGLYKAIRDFSPGSSSFWSFAKLCITRNIISAIKGTTRQKHIPLNSYTSLHKPIYDAEGDRTLMEVLSNNKVDDPEALVIDRERLYNTQKHIKEVLSEFEYKVFRLYINGLSYKEMAERLQTHTKSIDNALCRIKNKIESRF
ncbi:MAG: RNA polymerase sporulation sigma factor SigH [Firmicutes bacterium]|nr:RNA polymerase sporulation sigma factor SigH [Bacillota bacterium]MBO2520414.1 RNA polymerase sporulation sigma factor SigH [Bacillota bacterium]